MTTETKPFYPSGWPIDGRSTCRNGILRHPDRDPVVLKNGKWAPLEMQKKEEISL